MTARLLRKFLIVLIFICLWGCEESSSSFKWEVDSGMNENGICALESKNVTIVFKEWKKDDDWGVLRPHGAGTASSNNGVAGAASGPIEMIHVNDLNVIHFYDKHSIVKKDLKDRGKLLVVNAEPFSIGNERVTIVVPEDGKPFKREYKPEDSPLTAEEYREQTESVPPETVQ